MRPKDLQTRIFLDGGDPEETREIIAILGFLDGQTTNPTLISKNPMAKQRLERGEKFTGGEILDFYEGVVGEISSLIPAGSVSVEVYSDLSTKADEMLKQGKEMFSWIPNAHIKFPSSKEGLIAAERAVSEGLRVNLTSAFPWNRPPRSMPLRAGQREEMYSYLLLSEGLTIREKTGWT